MGANKCFIVKVEKTLLEGYFLIAVNLQSSKITKVISATMYKIIPN